MPLHWHDAHDGSPVMTGYRPDGTLWGQVAFYDVVDGAGPGWVGYVHGRRVTGCCSSWPEAMAEVERADGPTRSGSAVASPARGSRR